MKFIYPHTRENGVVSILSVIFFIILMSIIAVSFLRIVTNEQEQVIQDDLSKGALAAARSGVEDAKRALLYCRLNPAASACAMLANRPCPGVFADNPTGNFQTVLGLNRLGDGSIGVGDPTNNNNERYTCVTISQNTPDYTGIMREGLGDFIPLRGTGVFNQIRISWHQTALDGTAAIPPVGPISTDTNPRRTEWPASGTRYIAMPRIQLMQFDTTQPLSAQQDNSVGTFLVPNTGGAQTNCGNPALSPGSVCVNAIAPNSMPKRAAVNCVNPAPQQGYLCTAVLNLNFAQLGTSQYFLFIKSFYATAHYKVELLNNGAPTMFADVQPEVDSTGAAANVYKRILSRIQYQPDGFFTSNAIESGMSVCKNFSVTDDVFTNPCADLVLPLGSVPASETGPSGSPLP
ncbi:hypothetical protein EYC58_00570 [Candidatus Saccharibacteria bacterium]|nr:MAG: hypothetical protein EYC58_00570 [Candidatus Saccharibacteria bacterium]